jgi:hypothetical protein
MMKSSEWFAALFVTVCVLIICGFFIIVTYQRDTERANSKITFVAPQVKAHVDNFFAAAESHGVDINRRGLTVILHSFAGEDTLGCSYGEKTIWINRRTVLLDHLEPTEYNRLYIEALVFHELGHALLWRDHEWGTSIMNCCSQSVETYIHSPRYREHMISQMFLPNTRQSALPKTYFCSQLKK